MKVRPSVKPMCEHCKIRRKDVLWLFAQQIQNINNVRIIRRCNE